MPPTNPKPSAKPYRVTYNEMDCFYELITPAEAVLLRFPDEGEALEALEMVRRYMASDGHSPDA